MLTLFKDQEIPLKRAEAFLHARGLISSSLNKGGVGIWEHFFLELPTLLEAQDLDDIKQYFFKMTQWEFLKEVLQKKGTEYFFHGPTHCQCLQQDGSKTEFSLPLETEDWQLWLEILSVKYNQNWNVENPFASFHVELFGENFRLSLVHSSTSPLHQSKMVLRSLSRQSYSLQSFGETDILNSLIKEKKNLLIAGSTGSGKTSLLTSLLDLVPKDEHLVILEDTYEILNSHPHQTRFLSGTTPHTSLKSYLSYSLRLSPDRIILGEMRSHEVVPFLMAMNTGHSGLMGTLHASSAVDALQRVALLFSLYSQEANLSFEKIMELLCRNLQYVVFMEKKKVKEVIKILGSEKGVAFFEKVTQAHDKDQELPW